MIGRRAKGIWRGPLAILLFAFQIGAAADPIAAHHLQGTIHGYLVIKTEDGEVAAVGDLLQIVRGDRVTSRVTFHFKDGSLDDEITAFTQRGYFRLVSDSSHPERPLPPTHAMIDARSSLPKAMRSSTQHYLRHVS